MTEEQSSQMARTHSETLGKSLHIAFFEPALIDQAKRSRYSILCA
jgi:hypothetical protein